MAKQDKVADFDAQNLVICHPSLFTAMEIELYEQEILANPNATERDASKFFAQYPNFLLLGIGRELRREVVLVNSNSGSQYRVDFFRRSFGCSDWDIIELKTPKSNFVSCPKGEHPYPSPTVIKAISQAEDYREWIIKDTSVRANLLRRGISVYRPKILVVAGREGTIPNPKVLVRLSDRLRRGPVEAMSYDAIMRFAKEHYEEDRIIVFWSSIGSSQDELSSDVLFAKKIESILYREFPKGKAALPFSGRGVKWKIEKIDFYNGNLDLLLFARRELEKNMLMGAISEVLKKEFPNLDVSYSFDEKSPLDWVPPWKTRKELDGD